MQYLFSISLDFVSINDVFNALALCLNIRQMSETGMTDEDPGITNLQHEDEVSTLISPIYLFSRLIVYI